MGMMRGPNQGSGQGGQGQQVVMVVPQGNTGAGVSPKFVCQCITSVVILLYNI